MHANSNRSMSLAIRQRRPPRPSPTCRIPVSGMQGDFRSRRGRESGSAAPSEPPRLFPFVSVLWPFCQSFPVLPCGRGVPPPPERQSMARNPPRVKCCDPRDSETPCPAWRNSRFRPVGGVSIFDALLEFAPRFPARFAPVLTGKRPDPRPCRIGSRRRPGRFATEDDVLLRRPASGVARRRAPERIRAGTGREPARPQGAGLHSGEAGRSGDAGRTDRPAGKRNSEC